MHHVFIHSLAINLASGCDTEVNCRLRFCTNSVFQYTKSVIISFFFFFLLSMFLVKCQKQTLTGDL